MDAAALFGKVIIPCAYLARGDMRYRYFRSYKKHLSMTREEMQAYQDERLRALVEHSYRTVPYYQKLFDRIGLRSDDIRNASDLKKIPLLTKEDITKNHDLLKSRKRYSTIPVSSGGSTGNSVTILKDKRYNEISRAVFLRDLFRAGINPGEKVAWIWASPFETDSLEKKFFNRALWRINRRILFNSNRYNTDDLRRWLTGQFARFKPDYIYGYANSIHEIAQFIDQENIRIPRIKKIVSTAQKLEHRDYVERVFGCKMIDHYGCREVLSIAIEDDSYMMTSSDDFVIAELVTDKRIALTPLESYAMPLLRYVIGDIGERRGGRQTKDSPFRRFNLAVGRICEMLKTRDGKKIYPGAINLRVAEENIRVGRFQLIQHSYDHVEIKLVKSANYKDHDKQKMVKIIREILSTKQVTITEVDEYPIEKSGKTISYKCMIP